MVWFSLSSVVCNHTCKCDFLDSIIGGSFGLANTALNSSLSLHNQKELSLWNKDIAKELALFDQGLQQENLGFAKGLRDQSLTETPALERQGLVNAGYNPILAVNSAGGAPFSQQLSSHGPSSSGTSAPEVRGDLLGAIRDVAAIRQTNAQTDLIKRRALGEGWVVKTLTASEAKGLGASLIKSLGFHFNGSSSQTFLVAYNTITGEFRNLANTDDLGATETTNADTVPTVKVSGNGVDDMIHFYSDPNSDQPTSFHNLPR